MFRQIIHELKIVFRQAPALTACTFLMMLDIGICLYGRLNDPTIITGVPAWDKPLKFALSTGLYTGCLAAIVRYTQVWPRMVRASEHLAGIALFLEIVIIDLQAARHTTSHFNVATPLDTALWATMGSGILVLWISSILITMATFRAFYGTHVRTIALRWGMLIAILGMGSGAFMAVPSTAQKASVSTTHHLGGHTIGGVDGGPGLPFLSWSTQHGDVRPAHFIGLHAIQVLFLFALLVERLSLSNQKSSRVIIAGVLSYAVLFLLVLAEALLAKPLVDRAAPALGAWSVWMVATFTMFLVAMRCKSYSKPAILLRFSDTS